MNYSKINSIRGFVNFKHATKLSMSDKIGPPEAKRNGSPTETTVQRSHTHYQHG